MTPITYEGLRGIKFRIEWPEIDGSPRMVIPIDRENDTSLELCPVDLSTSKWFSWLRSDISHRRGRFIHIRHLQSMEEVKALVESLSGKNSESEEFDSANFSKALSRAKEEGEKNWKRYCDEGTAQNFVRRHS